MFRVVWVVGYSAVALTILFLFLGAVAYQSGNSISVAHQQGVLQSFASVLRADMYGVEDRNEFLRNHKILESFEVSAFIVDEKRKPVATSWSDDVPFGLREVMEAVANQPGLKSFEQIIELGDARLLWMFTPVSDNGEQLVLVHQCLNVGIGEIAELYIVPIAIAALLVIWATFWAAMSARKMIRSQARQARLEVDLLRHEEAAKIRSSFLANMSHELRTPLNAIIGFSEMMKLRAFGPLGHERNGEYVDNIHSAGQHMLKLVTNLLDLSRIEEGGEELTEEVIAPSALLDSIHLMVEPSCAEKEIRLAINVDAKIPDLRADSAKVKQILLHLCRNSLAHTPPGGKLDIGARLSRDGGIVIEVTDTGGGIEPAKLATLVANFGHAQSEAVIAKNGAGLGLPLSDALIGMHGGELRVVSVVDEGTTVRVIFPAGRTVRKVADTELQATG